LPRSKQIWIVEISSTKLKGRTLLSRALDRGKDQKVRRGDPKGCGLRKKKTKKKQGGGKKGEDGPETGHRGCVFCGRRGGAKNGEGKKRRPRKTPEKKTDAQDGSKIQMHQGQDGENDGLLGV